MTARRPASAFAPRGGRLRRGGLVREVIQRSPRESIIPGSRRALNSAVALREGRRGEGGDAREVVRRAGGGGCCAGVGPTPVGRQWGVGATGGGKRGMGAEALGDESTGRRQGAGCAAGNMGVWGDSFRMMRAAGNGRRTRAHVGPNSPRSSGSTALSSSSPNSAATSACKLRESAVTWSVLCAACSCWERRSSARFHMSARDSGIVSDSCASPRELHSVIGASCLSSSRRTPGVASMSAVHPPGSGLHPVRPPNGGFFCTPKPSNSYVRVGSRLQKLHGLRDTRA